MARFAGIALVFIGAALSAQQVPLTVTVNDQSGAIIPQAQVQVKAAVTGSISRQQADRAGQASFLLDPGPYVLTINSQGFRTSVSQADLQSEGKSFTAVLAIATCGPCVEVLPGPPMIETETAEVVPSIPFEPIQLLSTLPARRFKHSHSGKV
jgi:hypothetical protein